MSMEIFAITVTGRSEGAGTGCRRIHLVVRGRLERPPAERAVERVWIGVSETGQGFREVQAIGVVAPGEAVVNLRAEADIQGEEVWVARAPNGDGKARYRWKRGTAGPENICSHHPTRPSVVRRFIWEDSKGLWQATLFSCMIRRCCRAVVAKTPARASPLLEGQHSLGVYRSYGGRLRVDVGGTVWTVRPGDYLVVNPHEQTAVLPDSSWPLRYQKLDVSAARLRTLRDSWDLSRAWGPFEFAPGPRPVSGLVGAAWGVFETLAAGPFVFGGDGLADEATRLLVLGLLESHPSGVRARWEAGGGRFARDPRLQGVLSRIRQQGRQAVTVTGLARDAGVSVEWLRRAFRRALGVSPQEFMVRARMERAAELLKNPRQKVEDVAYAVGYGSASAFHRAYSAFARTTPRGRGAPPPDGGSSMTDQSRKKGVSPNS